MIDPSNPIQYLSRMNHSYLSSYHGVQRNHMVWFRQYLSDFFLLVAGIFGGNILTVGVITALGTDLFGLFGLKQLGPSLGAPLLTDILTHLVLAFGLTLMPALGIVGIFYLDYRAIRSSRR